MKRIIVLLLLCLTIGFVSAQEHSLGKDSQVSLANRLNLLEKKSDKMNLYFNFQSSFDAKDEGTDTWGADFKARQLRLEARGYLTDKLFYRFRHRLNRSNQARSVDNLSKATDIMYAGYHFNDKFAVIAGKQCQYWGGFEFDLNPMNIYEYSDYIEYMDNFMLGASFIYTPNKNQEFVLQVTDSRNDTFDKVYGNLIPQGMEASRTPLTYILNWNGSLFNNIIKTRWAAGVQTEAKDTYTYTITLGTKLNLPKFQLAFDYMRDDCDLDRLGIVTGDFAQPAAVEDVLYNTFIAKAEYQPVREWNIFVKGMYETASSDQFEALKDYRTSYGYFAGVEYLPFADQDLRVFLTYVGRKVEYDKDIFHNYDSNRVSLGIMYRIKAF